MFFRLLKMLFKLSLRILLLPIFTFILFWPFMMEYLSSDPDWDEFYEIWKDILNIYGFRKIEKKLKSKPELNGALLGDANLDLYKDVYSKRS